MEHPEVRRRRRHQRQGAAVQRRRQHPHAGRLIPRRQGQFLQVHQRDPQRDRGRVADSGQRYLAAVNGSASGGGYELALACDHIVLVDDNSSAVSLPEVPLLGVLPGTGGLTRVVDKRKVRRDLADVFATTAEGVRGRKALEWRLVDELAPRSRMADVVAERAAGHGRDVRPAGRRRRDQPDATRAPGHRGRRHLRPRHRHASIATPARCEITVTGPGDERAGRRRRNSSPVATARGPWRPCAQLDDLILHLRTNEPELGTWILRTTGDPERMQATDEALRTHADHWLVREIVLYWKRTLKRLDMTSRSLIALDRAGLLLHRHPVRTGPGRRPLLPARCRRRARRSG